ncbi:SDR family NAD(P)-dependent oxidoreductase [Pseudonocardia nigra]|uniref:SDR family NAD(P)-dependent oxidoreductase n=1 Tax=Pseudonocardia nigra TaxID=1921578 RepID=UPI001FE60243|nr:SDR family oxidoreductase [Pseudonocardia nigra]
MGNSGAGRLAGKVAVVTGATSGIGEATARLFVAEGASVVVAGRDTRRGEAVAGELGERGVFHRTDVTSEEEIAELVRCTVDRFGRLDCLFSNAGAPVAGGVATITVTEFDRAMRLLLGSVLFGLKHAAPEIARSGGGSIIHNSSIAAHRMGQGSLLYSAAKAAVSHVTRLAAVELGPQGIRVNAISPGAVATPIFWGGSAAAARLADEDNRRKQAKLERNLARATPLPRAGTPEDVARAALFLASDEGGFVNGHDLVVDGGRIAQFHERPADR